MFKKENHNIPKDYDKSIKNPNEESINQAVTGNVKNSGGKIPKKRLVVAMVVILALIGLLGFGYVLYENIQSSNNEQNAADIADEPLTEGELTKKIVDLEGNVSDSYGYEELGLLYLEKGDYKLAIVNLNKALDNEEISDEKNVYSALAVAYYFNKQNDLAIQSYEKLIKLYDSTEITAYDQAKVNDYKESIDRLNKGLEL